MTYLYGHKSRENEALQRALAALNLYRGKIDGAHGPKTRDAVIEAQLLYGIDPHDGIVRADLLLELGITSQPAPKSNPLLQDWLIGLAIKQVLPKLKGLPAMNFLSGQKTVITGVLMVIVGGISLVAPLIGLGAIPGFDALSPGEAWTSITGGFGLIFLRQGVTKEVKKVSQ